MHTVHPTMKVPRAPTARLRADRGSVRVRACSSDSLFLFSLSEQDTITSNNMENSKHETQSHSAYRFGDAQMFTI